MTTSSSSSTLSIAVIFANLKGNLGDFAILHAMLKRIAIHHPSHDIHVYSHPMQPDDVRRTDAFFQKAPAFIHSGQHYKPKLNSISLMALKLRLVPGGLAAVISRLSRKSAAEFRYFSKYDAVYVAGGEQWNGRKLGAAMVASITALHDLGVPVYCFPFSVKPKIAKLYGRTQIRQLFSPLQKPVIVRDAATAAFLARSDVSTTLGIDTVFSLRSEVAEIPPAVHRNQERVLLAVTGLYSNIHAVASTLVSAGYVVEAITTCEIEDRENLERLRRDLGIDYIAPVTWQDFVAEIKVSRIVVTNRLHGLIFSTLSGSLPFPVTDRNKVGAFVADAKIANHSTSLSAIDGKMFADAIACREETLGQLDAYLVHCAGLPFSPV